MILPVSLTYDDLLRLFKYCGYVVLVVAGGILLFRPPELQAHPVKVIWQSVSTALAVPPLLIWGLSKLKWKYPKLAWLMGKRMVHGLWWGELKTEFKPTDGADSLPPITGRPNDLVHAICCFGARSAIISSKFRKLSG